MISSCLPGGSANCFAGDYHLLLKSEIANSRAVYDQSKITREAHPY
jgi:hypothetical protein